MSRHAMQTRTTNIIQESRRTLSYKNGFTIFCNPIGSVLRVWVGKTTNWKAEHNCASTDPTRSKTR